MVFAGDMNPDSIGRFYCERFFLLPRQDSKNYISSLIEILSENSIEILIPFGELECLRISKQKDRFIDIGCIPIVTNLKTLETSLEKIVSYDFLTKNTDIPFMKYHLVESLDDLDAGLEKIGHDVNLSIKPSRGVGSRGFVVLSNSTISISNLFSSKNSFPHISIMDLREMMKSNGNFPKLILMEMLDGEHYDSNMICKNGSVLFQSVRTREEVINGAISKATIVKNDNIFNINKKIAKALNADGYICTQYIGDKLIEVNPRWSTSVNYNNFNEYLMAIELAVEGGIKICVDNYDNYDDYVGVKFLRFFDTLAYK